MEAGLGVYMDTLQKDKTAKDRVARNEAKMRSLGFVKVHPWVHVDDRQKLLDYATELRKQHSL